VKSAAMRTNVSKQAMRQPTVASPPSVCVDSNTTRLSEDRVEGPHSAFFSETRISDLVHYIHTHTQTYESP